MIRTATEQQALSIAALILHPRELERGEHLARDTYASVRDLAAEACGMIHRDRYLLDPEPVAVQMRGKVAIPEGLPCLINGFRKPSRTRSRRKKVTA